MKKFTTKNFQETQIIGQNFASEILTTKLGKSAMILALQGDLGAGKTTFLQGFARGIGIKENILSPTFIIMKKFQIPNAKFTNFYHFDCYRLNNPEEILHLGFKEIISDPKNIIAIEWPEKIGKILPKNILKIKFYYTDKDKRKLTIN